jgi:hypothetical protein
MMDAIKTLKTALAHAKFEDADIKSATDKLINSLGDELNAAGYDAGTDVEVAANELEAVITTVEQEKENPPGKAGDDDEDEFEGLGEETE